MIAQIIMIIIINILIILIITVGRTLLAPGLRRVVRRPDGRLQEVLGCLFIC